MQVPSGHKPVEQKNTQPQEVVPSKSWGFDRAFDFLSNTCHKLTQVFTTSKLYSEKELSILLSEHDRKIIDKGEEVLQKNPEYTTQQLWTAVWFGDADANAIAASEEEDTESDLHTPTSESSSQIEELTAENHKLREENALLRNQPTGSPREQQLVELIRELVASGAQPISRTPYNYSSEHLAVPFITDKLLDTLQKPGEWFQREVVEKDGKKIMTSRLTVPGKAAVQTLEKLGLISQDATAQGGVLYRPQPKWNNENSINFLRREFMNWTAGQKELVIDHEKAEGFLNLEEGQAYAVLDKYTNGSASDSQKAATSLGFPPRDELFRHALGLARAYALEVLEKRAGELFENAQDKQCMTKLQGDFKEYPGLKIQVKSMFAKRDEGVQNLQKHYKELEAQAEEIKAKQALIQSVLRGEQPAAKSNFAPPPPPPPPF